MRAISLFTFVLVDTFGWGIDVNMKIVKVRMKLAPGSSVLAVVWECSTANVRWKTGRKSRMTTVLRLEIIVIELPQELTVLNGEFLFQLAHMLENNR